MKLEDLGYNDTLEKSRIENNLRDFEIGRVVSEHKERYIVRTEQGEFEAEITGNLRFSARNREDFPAVGDWVALTTYDPDLSIIHKILPRFSTISRQAAGQFGEIQVIAANVDYALLVQAVDRDFNINRLERYLTICYSSKVSPVIVLTKTDLISEPAKVEIIDSINKRIKNIPVFAISNETRDGYDSLKKIFEKGKTFCLLGSSGVGKSTLLNNLSGRIIMKTDAISESTNKGRHITSHRELIVLENGGIVIDNPGMREVGIADTAYGLETTFDIIVSLSRNCKFKDCTHTGETGCSLLEAVEKGEIDKNSYENYLKMEKEKIHFESSAAERRKKDKDFGKMVKNYKKKMNKEFIIIFILLLTLSISSKADIIYSPYNYFNIAGSFEFIGSYEMPFSSLNTFSPWGGFGIVSSSIISFNPSIGSEIGVEVRQYFRRDRFKRFNIGLYGGMAYMMNLSISRAHIYHDNNSVGIVPGLKLTYKFKEKPRMAFEPYIGISNPFHYELADSGSWENLGIVYTIGFRISLNELKNRKKCVA
jgi:ribosome biogenesis GTPase